MLAPLHTNSIACMPTDLTTATCTGLSKWLVGCQQPQGLQETLPWRLAGMMPLHQDHGMGARANTEAPALCSEQVPRETGLRTILCVCSIHLLTLPQLSSCKGVSLAPHSARRPAQHTHSFMSLYMAVWQVQSLPIVPGSSKVAEGLSGTRQIMGKLASFAHPKEHCK